MIKRNKTIPMKKEQNKVCKRVFRGILFSTLFAGTALLSATSANAATEATVYEGLCIEDVDVSGMNEQQVRDAIAGIVQVRSQDEITLHMNGNHYTTNVQAMGYTWTNEEVVGEVLEYGKRGNVISRYKQKEALKQEGVSFPINGVVDSAAIQAVLEANCVAFNQPAQDYSIKCENNAMVHVPGVPGVELDVAASVNTVTAFMNEQWHSGPADIDLDVIVIEPGGDEEMLSKITDKLGAGSTDYSSSSKNRKQNVENAVSKIDGTILYPGESFSVLDAVLPFEIDNGYASAASYMQGEVVESVGGGVCQVSSTLYLSLIRAELQIDKRFSHSMLVAYVKPGYDAAVAEGSKDLVFTNNTEAPIYIHGTTDGSTVAFTIFGMDTRSEDREFRFEVENLSSTNERVKKMVKLWKYVTENGETEKIAVNTSTYYKSNAEEERENAAVQNVINAINAIGNVSLESGSAISAAESAYGSLTGAQQAKVTNYGALTNARAVYNQLKQAADAAAQQAAADAAAQQAAQEAAQQQAQ